MMKYLVCFTVLTLCLMDIALAGPMEVCGYEWQCRARNEPMCANTRCRVGQICTTCYCRPSCSWGKRDLMSVLQSQ